MTKDNIEIDPLWGIGNIERDGIDPSAVGAVSTVWKLMALAPYAEPLTITLAEWIARLRYIPEAGGSRTGEVSDPNKILRWAAQFSAREKAAQTANEEEHRRLNVVLAKMMMSDVEFLQATRTRVLNDDGIDFEKELLTYYPRLRDHEPT